MIFDINVSISMREDNKEFTPSNAVEDNHGRGRTKNICGHLGHSYFYQLSFASVYVTTRIAAWERPVEQYEEQQLCRRLETHILSGRKSINIHL